jgi:guanylate kinase
LSISNNPTSGAHESPLLVVLSGPSGVGKDAVLAHLRSTGSPYHFTITATTRPKRDRELHGIDYLFLSSSEFDNMVKANKFLEWAHVYGNRYGIPRDQVRTALGKGLDVIIKADVQGAATIKKLAPEALFIFLVAPSLEELEWRLRDRKTETTTDLRLRLRTAKAEMGHQPMFDYVVINRDHGLDIAVADIKAIIANEKRRVPPRRIVL